MHDEKVYRKAKSASALARSSARSLRQSMTPPECALWVAIRGRKVAGLRFRRQAPIGPFVADFYCHELRLVIEIDGSMHQGEKLIRDQVRDKWMQTRGIQVLRVQGREILQNLEGVIRTIQQIAEPPPSR